MSVFYCLYVAFTHTLSFVLQAELNKVASENGSVEGGKQSDGEKSNDKSGTSNTKHHTLFLQVNRL